MSDVSLPVIGAEPWGEDLNAYLAQMEAEIDTNTGQISTNAADIANHTAQIADLLTLTGAQSTQISALTSQVSGLAAQVSTLATQNSSLLSRVTALEAKPEYVWGNASYMFSSALPPSTGNQIRLNNVNPQAATMMDVRKIDADGADRSLILGMVTTNTLIRLQDFDDAANWYRYRVTGPIVKVGVDNINVPVVWYAGQGSVPSAKINVGMLIDIQTP